MLRRYLVSLTLCICALAGLAYLLRVLPPLDQDSVKTIVLLEDITSEEQLLGVIRRMTQDGLIVNYLNWRNTIINSLLLCIAVFSAFVLVHSIIDKFFISKFYQEPSLPKALRRGALVAGCVLATIFMHLYNASWYLFASVYAFALIVEILITQAQRKPDNLPLPPQPKVEQPNFLLVQEEVVAVATADEVIVQQEVEITELSTNGENVDN